MLDAQLLAAAMSSREAWNRIGPHFTAEEFTPVSKFWYKLVAEWYAQDKLAKGIDKSLLVERGRLRITNPKHEDSLIGFMNDLPDPPSADNVVQLALELKRHNVGNELGAALAQQDRRKIKSLLAQYAQLQEATTLGNKRTEWQDSVAVEELFNKVGKENRIPIAPSRVNVKAGGGALPGHHILVYGRPEEGKSTFSINMAYGFVKQKIRVDYIGNEDHIDVLKSRMMARITGMPWEECEAKPEKAIRLYRERGGEEYLNMFQLKHGTLEAIARKVEESQPQVIIIDQLRNLEVAGVEGGKMTTKLEELGKQTRNLLLDYGLIGISVTQARSRETKPGGEPSIFLGMEDIDSSHTGLPGAVDLTIGIASNNQLKQRKQRFASFAKNKLSNADDAHTGLTLEFDSKLNKVI